MPQTPAAATVDQVQTEKLVSDILATVDREREREIIARRFGLFDRKETLEQIGEMLGITRERVRQLEKSVITRLRASAEQGQLPHVADFQTALLELLHQDGETARVSAIAAQLASGNPSREEQARVAFLSQLSPDVAVITEDDNFYYSVGVKSVRDEKALKSAVSDLIQTIADLGEPKPIEEIAKAAGMDDPKQTAALASVSKHLATLNGRWGLVKWPMVNPKNIRDKIYVILKENGKQMHFNEIIKDKRFVLIGRGMYALKEWGYQKGTVADVIADVLRDANEPLHRDEIVKRVLKSRFVKETTILLNLQGKPQFKRVAKATYALAEAEMA